MYWSILDRGWKLEKNAARKISQSDALDAHSGAAQVRQEFSKRVKLEAFKRSGGQCEGCTARLFVGRFDYHHDREDTMGGEPTLQNCKVLCDACHDKITKEHAPIIAKSNRQRNKHLGIKRKSGFQTNRNGRFRKKMDGTVVLRSLPSAE